MSFLAMLIALAIRQLSGLAAALQRDGWYNSWLARLRGWRLGDWLSLALAVLAPALLAQWVLHTVQHRLFGLMWIALAAALLLYSFGRRDFDELEARYQSQVAAGDFEAAYLLLAAELGWSHTPQAQAAAPDTPAELHAQAERAFCYAALQRWFAVLFYFLLLGPAGALAYRLLQLARPVLAPQPVVRCLFLADWLPSRLLAATFALAGDFVHSRGVLLDAITQPAEPADTTLYRVGVAALGARASSWIGWQDSLQDGATAQHEFRQTAVAEHNALRALLSRSAAAWVVAVSVLVLIA